MSNEIQTSEMSKALAALPDLGPLQYGEVGDFDRMVRSAFLPRLSLCSGSSDLVKEGKMMVGRYALVRAKDDFVDLGEAVDLIPLDMRYAAMDFGDMSNVQVSYDPNDPLFKDIMSRAGQQGARVGYGPQFLIWLPSQKEFASYFFGSQSARPEARKMMARKKMGATMRAKLVSTPENKWHVPVVIACQTELTPPPADQYAEVGTKFLHPGKSEGAEFSPESGSAAAGPEGERVR